MPSAEIITIGTEILLGEIVDTNAAFIARALRDVGVNLHRKTTVGDNARRIAQAIQEAIERADIIITTGGLGPTVDDPTREAVALSMDVEMEFRQELWEQIQDRFRRFGRQPTENNRRQAYLPVGADGVENPVGTAPAFFFDTGSSVIYSLPGVPREMEHLVEHAMIPFLRQRFDLKGIIKSLLLHTSGVGESQIDDLIGDLEILENPTVGMAAHAGQVDIRITAKADSLEEADRMIEELEIEIRKRLGKWIYGAGEETLEKAALNTLAALGWRASVLEYGLNGCLTQRLSDAAGPFDGGELLTSLPETHLLPELTRAHYHSRRTETVLGAALYPNGEKQELQLVLISPLGERQIARSYGGPASLAPTWAVNLCLDLLRKLGS